MHLLYRGMIIGLHNLLYHLLLIRISLDSTNQPVVGRKRKICTAVFQLGCMQFPNPTFWYWHQTLWPPFNLSIGIMVYGMYLPQRLRCIFFLSDHKHSIPKHCHPIKDTWIYILGIFALHLPPVTAWAFWMDPSECDDVL